MSRFEELLNASIENQSINKAKVLNNARTWFIYETPGQPNSDKPFIVTPNGTFQPVLNTGTRQETPGEPVSGPFNDNMSYPTANSQTPLKSVTEAVKGACPKCGADIKWSEKRKNGNSGCIHNHVYPTKEFYKD